MRLQRAFTLLEVGISLAIFSLFLVVFYAMLSSGQGLWSRNSSSHDALFQLQRVRGAMEADIREARVSQMKVRGDAEAIWFASAQDPVTGELIRTDDGSPYWTYNILYYLTIPTDHDELFGINCAQEARCPHKFLIRRVLRKQALAASELEPTPIERIFQQVEILEFLESPTGYSLNFDAPSDEPPYVVESELIASGLLSFQVEVGATDPWDNEVKISVSAFALDKATQTIRIGEEDLTDSPFTEWLVFSIFPDH